MNLLDLLLAHAQPGYERGLTVIAQRWVKMMGPAAFAGADLDGAVETALRHAEGDAQGGQTGLIAGDLSSLVWWCGAQMDATRQARLARAVRAAAGRTFDALNFPDAPMTAAPKRRVLWTGALQSPKHSPSRGAADLAATLLADPEVEQLDIYHGGAIPAPMKAYLVERLGKAASRVGLIPTDSETHWSSVIDRGPAIHHVWCDYAARLHLALAARMGPVAMYACGDQPPMQYADAYWFYHRPDYIARRWAEEGAPAGMAGRYVETLAGPHNPALTAPNKAAREAFGLPADKVVITTVGNRLAVDFDQAFVDGMGGLIAANPGLHWRVVGALPEWLADACAQVLGEGFSHQPYEAELGRFMTTVDLFANPFRRGGGDTAVTAMLGGAGVVSLEEGDVGGLIPAEHRWADADAYFAALTELATDAPHRAAFVARQAGHIAQLTDQTLFGAEVRRLEAIALERFNARRSQAPWRIDDTPAEASAAA